MACSHDAELEETSGSDLGFCAVSLPVDDRETENGAPEAGCPAAETFW